MAEQSVQIGIPPALEEKVIGVLIEKILKYDFDDISELIIVTDPPEVKGTLHPVDRFYINRLVWKATLEGLYKNYLPDVKYSFDWKIEISPYTLMLCKMLAPDEIKEAYRNEILDKTNSREDVIKLNKDALSNLDICISKFPEVLKKQLPDDELELFGLLYRIMNFPPLEELARFYHQVYKRYTEGLNLLISAFGKKDKEAMRLPSFTVLEPLNNSVMPFSHKVFSKFGLQYLKNLPELSKWKDQFEIIEDKSTRFKDTFSGTFICSCCGTEHSATVPIEILEYKFLLEHSDLCKEIGFLLLDEITYDYQLSLATGISNFLKNINSVEKPDVLILVEGASEETSIPLLGFRKRFLLFQHKIFVYNSGSKEQLFRDFRAFKTKYPSIYIICLLDKDAIREKNDIGRMIKNKRNKYELIYLNRGTWEDIFPLEVSVEVLNELYVEGEEIVVEDFDAAKDFNTNIRSILYQKKKAEFDKVKFAELLSLRIDIDKLPLEITRIFETAEKFKNTADSMFRTSTSD